MKTIFSLGITKGVLSGLVGTIGGIGITTLIRLAIGLPVSDLEPAIVIGIVVGVITYLITLGVFSYWFRWAVKGRLEDHEPAQTKQGWTRYFSADTNHKIIGIQYLVTAMVFLPFAIALQLVGRLDLSQLIPALSTNAYESLISVHGLTMFFIVVIPAFTGLMNYLIPLQIGAKDMAFPHLNALTYWMLPPAGFLLIFSLLGGGFNTGWTVYPPLSAAFQNVSMDLALIAIYLAGLSSILTGANVLATVFKMRAPGLKFFRLPIFVWTSVATTAMTLTFTQFVGMAFLTVLLERILGMGFYNPQLGGQVLLYQYMFWFYSHPAVYVFVLIGLGIISDLIPVFSRKPLFGYKAVAISGPAIAIGGMFVFAHHMFAAGMNAALRVPFMVTTMLVAVPTGIKVFAWVVTMWQGKLRLSTPFLFVLTSIVTFLVGGLAGIPLGIVPVDLYLHDTYWVVGHFHAMLFGGFLLPVMAAIYYWFPKATGKMLSERLGKIQWLLMTIGNFALILPMLGLGLEGMRRRVVVAPAGINSFPLNLTTALAGFIIFAGIVIMAINLIRSFRYGKIAGDNPWGARTLEWQIPSPPPEENFSLTPHVIGDPFGYGTEGTHAIMEPETAEGVKNE